MPITHLIRRPWSGVKAGDRVDVTGWRNTARLESLGYIRLLTPEELRDGPPKTPPASDASTAPPAPKVQAKAAAAAAPLPVPPPADAPDTPTPIVQPEQVAAALGAEEVKPAPAAAPARAPSRRISPDITEVGKTPQARRLPE